MCTCVSTASERFECNSTCKVQDAKLAKPAVGVPYPVGYRVVNKERPQDAKDYEGVELKLLCPSASHDDGHHKREHHLIGSK